MTSVLLLHAYSASNAGDGLLVTLSLDAIHAAVDDAEVTVVALHPETFHDVDATVVDYSLKARLRRRSAWSTVKAQRPDLVVGVGGGYLRSGRPLETLKTLLAHLPQLRFAARSAAPSVYLPQSVGPLRLGTATLWRRYLRRLTALHLRDGRSVAEVDAPNTLRSPDLAALRMTTSRGDTAVDPVPVLTVRQVHGVLPAPVQELAGLLDTFDGYVQSRGHGNDDVAATAELATRSVLEAADFLSSEGPRRVVVAVRLHAALMALNAGHYVIHLAYERKGFGAFEDLGLDDYVVSVQSFDPDHVARLARELLEDPQARAAYDARIAGRRTHLLESMSALQEQIRRLTEGVRP